MHWFKTLGLLEDTKPIVLEDWKSFIRMSLEKQYDMKLPDDLASFLSILASFVPPPHYEGVVTVLMQLSLISGDATSLPSLPKRPTLPIDLFAIVLAHKLKYEPNERDLVVLFHEIIAQPADKPHVEEIYTSSLVTYGTPAASAMSRCVGLPVAFASLQVLDGKVPVRGVKGPTDATIYGPVLDGLKVVGLSMKETFAKGKGMEDILADGLIGHHSPT